MIRLFRYGLQLHYDRDYGIDRRTGWTAVRDGRVLEPQLTSLPRALWAFVVDVWRDTNGG